MFSTTKGGVAPCTFSLLNCKWPKVTDCYCCKWFTGFYMYIGQYVTALVANTVLFVYQLWCIPSTIAVASGCWMCSCQVWICLRVSTPSSMQPWRNWTQRQPRWLKTRSHFCPTMLKLYSWWKTSELYSRTWKRQHLVNPVHPCSPISDILHAPLTYTHTDLTFMSLDS